MVIRSSRETLPPDKRPQIITALVSPLKRTMVLASSMKRVSGSTTLHGRHYLNTNPHLRAALQNSIPLHSQYQLHRVGGYGELVSYRAYLGWTFWMGLLFFHGESLEKIKPSG
jgi:hypothetical protein